MAAISHRADVNYSQLITCSLRNLVVATRMASGRSTVLQPIMRWWWKVRQSTITAILKSATATGRTARSSLRRRGVTMQKPDSLSAYFDQGARLPSAVGKMKSKPKFIQVFSRQSEINWLSSARFFLFGSRDAWFVVGLPVYLVSVLERSFTEVGTFFAFWVMGYEFVLAVAPKLLSRMRHGNAPKGSTARVWAMLLASVPIVLALGRG